MACGTERAVMQYAPSRQGWQRSATALGRQGVKCVSAAVDVVRRPASGVVVLIYHRVGGGSDLQIDLPVDAFRRQVEMLAESGLVVTLDEAIEQLRASDDAKGVVVTFDDGTADLAANAFPVLVELEVPATVYVATGFVEAQRDFPDHGRPLSWSALADVVSTGVVGVGSHTHTHALLDRIGPEAVDEELERSKGLIEERLGVPARHFAYPKAVAGSTYADAAVRQHFESAALAGTRANRPGCDVHRLARTPIQISDGEQWFRRKTRGGLTLEDEIRTLINKLRYRSVTC